MFSSHRITGLAVVTGRRRFGSYGAFVLIASLFVFAVCAGTAVASSGDALMSWGINEFGELGVGTSSGPDTCPSPGGFACSTSGVQVSLPKGIIVTAAAAGEGHSLAVTSAGQVLAWGGNFYGQLGDGTYRGPATCDVSQPTACSTRPVPARLPTGTKAVAVAAGDGYSLAVTSFGHVFAWGDSADGKLGDGTISGPASCGGEPCATTPVATRLPVGIEAVAVAAGDNHSLALTSTGQVWAWGNNANGELGDGTLTGPTTCNVAPCSKVPVKVKLPSGIKAVAVAAGQNYSLALSSTGQVWAWGENEFGELGVGRAGGSTDLPVKVKLPAGTTVGAIAAVRTGGLAVTSTGQVWAWGWNLYGQLGDGTSTGPDTCSGAPCSTTPVQMMLPSATKAVAVAGGDDQSLVLTSTGKVLAAGLNWVGQLGDGTSTGPATCDVPNPIGCSTTPVEVELPGVLAIGLAPGPMASHELAIANIEGS